MSRLIVVAQVVEKQGAVAEVKSELLKLIAPTRQLRPDRTGREICGFGLTFGP